VGATVGSTVADVLGIAERHLHDLAPDRDVLAAPLLKSLPAPRAHRHRHLIIRAPGILRPLEHLSRHHQERLVLIELAAHFASQPRHRLAPKRIRIGRHLESQHMPPWPWMSWIVRQVAGLAPTDERLDLPHCFA